MNLIDKILNMKMRYKVAYLLILIPIVCVMFNIRF